MSRNQHGDWKTQITAVKEKLIHFSSVDANACCEDLKLAWHSFNGCWGNVLAIIKKPVNILTG